jgi:cobalt-zinc-cadmium efflux system outer membrane protein
MPVRVPLSVCAGGLLVGCLAAEVAGQTPLTWADVLAHYRANNPTLRAGAIGVDESRADEITAHLRPNPQASVLADQIALARPADGASRLDNQLTTTSVSYLIELGHKRQLRLASARGATAIARSTQADLDRQQTLALRTAFVQLLQAKGLLALAREELSDYQKVIEVGHERLKAGDISRADLDRLELQVVQYQSDLQSATVSLRTARVQLLQLMNEKMSVDQLDVDAPYDFAPLTPGLDDLRAAALQGRPDLEAARQAVDKAKTDDRLAAANGTWDPTLGVDVGLPRSSGSPNYFGVGLSLPLRLFDRNQGEKLKARLEIERSERLAEAVRNQVTSDVESAYATVVSTVTLLQPYRDTYLAQATRIRDTATFSYERGAMALVDFLQARQEYRAVQIAYVNLIAAYLNAVAQLNFSVGREVVS